MQKYSSAQVAMRTAANAPKEIPTIVPIERLLDKLCLAKLFVGELVLLVLDELFLLVLDEV